MKIFKKQSGFTLVELLVVIAIIAVLGVVAIAAINPAQRIASAKDAQALANVQQVGKALEACTTEKMSTGTFMTLDAAVASCCGVAVAGTCVNTGLSTNGYGFGTGFPANLVATRGPVPTAPATAVSVCVSQVNGSDALYTKYILGGGTTSKTAAAACSATTGT